MIEDDIRYLYGRMDDLELLINHLLQTIIKEPVTHSKDCIKYESELISLYGYNTDNCRCIAEKINDMLGFKTSKILSEDQINDLRKKYRENKKAERKNRAKKKAKKVRRKARKV